MTPSLGLIHLLDWLTELGEVLEYWFIMKEYNSGRARWKRSIGKGTGKEHAASMPSPVMPLSQYLPVFTNQEAPCTRFGFLEAKLD